MGCGPGDTSSVAACASPGVSDDRIDLGVLYPDSGPVSPIFEAARAGIDARLGAVNAAGGVNGRRVVYQWRDDQGSPLTNGIAARDLVEQRRVFGVVELSVAASGSAGYLAQQGVPVTGLASEQVWSQDRNMFAATTATDAAVDTQGRFVRDQGGSRAVILQTALSAGVSATASTYARSLAAAGVQVLGTVTFTTGVDDPVAVARRIVAARADTIVGVSSRRTSSPSWPCCAPRATTRRSYCPPTGTTMRCCVLSVRRRRESPCRCSTGLSRSADRGSTPISRRCVSLRHRSPSPSRILR